MIRHNSFLSYLDHWDLLEDFSNEEIGLVYRSLYGFALSGTEPHIEDRAVRAVYKTMRNAIVRDDAKYAERCEKNRQIAQKAWDRRKGDANAYERIQPHTMDADNDSDNGSELDNDSDPDKSVQYSGHELVDKSIRDFIQFRKDIKKPMTEKAIQIFIKRLESLSSDPDTKIKLIEQAIEHGWQTVYPLRDTSKGGKFGDIMRHDWNMGELEKTLLSKNGDAPGEDIVEYFKGLSSSSSP